MGGGILLIYLSELSVLFRRAGGVWEGCQKSCFSEVAKTCQREVARDEDGNGDEIAVKKGKV